MGGGGGHERRVQLPPPPPPAHTATTPPAHTRAPALTGGRRGKVEEWVPRDQSEQVDGLAIRALGQQPCVELANVCMCVGGCSRSGREGGQHARAGWLADRQAGGRGAARASAGCPGRPTHSQVSSVMQPSQPKRPMALRRSEGVMLRSTMNTASACVWCVCVWCVRVGGGWWVRAARRVHAHNARARSSTLRSATHARPPKHACHARTHKQAGRHLSRQVSAHL